MLNKREFDEACKQILEQGLQMDVLMIKQNDKVFKHIFGEKELKISIRSISKPITCLCFGLAIQMGLFKNGLNELVYDYLCQTQNIKNVDNIKHIKKWTIKTLLTLTIGYEKKMLDSKHLLTIENENYADVVLNYPIAHEPNTYFLYSNAAMYLASVVFQNATGYKLLEFANNYLFSKLGIEGVFWKESPQGYNMGCTGIEMYADDLMKIGQLILNKGKYNDEQIISEDWVLQMLTPQVLTPEMYDATRVLPKYAYGLNLWLCQDGISYCDGTDGQYLIIIPNKNMVIVTGGHQSNMKPITKCLEQIIRMED